MAYDAFLKLDGITGESQKDQHAGEIDIMSFSWGASNSTSVGTGTGVSTGKVSVSDFSIMKSTDSSSPVLFQKSCDGSVIATGVVTLQKQSGTGDKISYLVYNFTNVYVTSIQWSGSGGAGGGDSPMESVSFTFEVCTVDYTAQQDAGGGGGAVHGGWDVGQNVKA
jgi:type VI secretion system secreted protein Hcp